MQQYLFLLGDNSILKVKKFNFITKKLLCTYIFYLVIYTKYVTKYGINFFKSLEYETQLFFINFHFLLIPQYLLYFTEIGFVHPKSDQLKNVGGIHFGKIIPFSTRFLMPLCVLTKNPDFSCTCSISNYNNCIFEKDI